MFRDNRDDIDNNEDVDLNDMIHQYNEDNELRRKINEMKKQKEEGYKQESSFDPDDSAFVNIPRASQAGIPDIRIDQDIEKTRVDFSDDSDKTLVIMDRKNKVESQTQSVFENEAYQKPNVSSSALHNEEYEPEEDIRETIKKRRLEKEQEEMDPEEDEKSKNVNKIITYVIIGILSVAVLVGAGFGIKYMFFNGSSTDKVEDKKEDKKEDTKDKDTNKKDNEETTKPKEDDTDIKDNSAIITQLKSQLKAYENQLKKVDDDIATAESDKKSAQDALNNIATLKTQMDTLAGQMKEIASSEDEAKKAADDTCKIDAASQDCIDAKAKYESYRQMNSQHTLAKQQYDTESAKDAAYRKEVSDADEKISSLKTKKTGIEKDIAEKTTELAKYE